MFITVVKIKIKIFFDNIHNIKTHKTVESFTETVDIFKKHLVFIFGKLGVHNIFFKILVFRVKIQPMFCKSTNLITVIVNTFNSGITAYLKIYNTHTVRIFFNQTVNKRYCLSKLSKRKMRNCLSKSQNILVKFLHKRSFRSLIGLININKTLCNGNSPCVKKSQQNKFKVV